MKGSMVFFFFFFRSVDNENQQIEMANLVQKGNNSVNEVSKKNYNVAQYVAIPFLNKYNIVKMNWIRTKGVFLQNRCIIRFDGVEHKFKRKAFLTVMNSQSTTMSKFILWIATSFWSINSLRDRFNSKMLIFIQFYNRKTHNFSHHLDMNRKIIENISKQCETYCAPIMWVY